MIIVIVGPTGVGKTALSLALAKHFKTEIISGDAMQIYQSMDIGTAKIPSNKKAGIPHHMIDILKPDESYSVADYQRDVRRHIEKQLKQDKLPIIVGGTGFYIKSVLYDYCFEDDKRDLELEQHYQTMDNETLHAQLKKYDEKKAATLHPNNKKRVLRALVQAKKGTPLSQKKGKDTPVYDYCMIFLNKKRDELYRIIDQRVDDMFGAGLIQESQKLYQKNLSKTAQQAIGYKELFASFEGQYDLDEAKSLIKRHSRQYAKRQLTYFKHQFKAHEIDTTNKTFNAIFEAAKDVIKQAIDAKN